jgi:hypothetical protein
MLSRLHWRIVRVAVTTLNPGRNGKKFGMGAKLEPTIGLEPMTCRLRIGCSTN